MNILITSAGKRVSLVRSFQAELKKIYRTGKVYTTDLQPQLSAACQISDGYFRVVCVSDTSYLQQLLAICIQQNVSMVIPTIDTELAVLSRHKKLFASNGIEIIVSSASVVDMCRDKRKTKLFFSSVGINTPEDVDKHNPTYPFFVKPIDGSLSADTYVVKRHSEVKREHQENDRFMFMEYFSPEEYDEFTVDMYYDRTSYLKCLVPRKRLLVRAGEINKGITCRNVIVDLLKEKMNFFEGAVGCITAQFFAHKIANTIVGIEINPRFGGGYPLSYNAGANYPSWLIREYLRGDRIPYFEEWLDGTLMLRYDEEIIVYANRNQPEKLFHIRS